MFSAKDIYIAAIKYIIKKLHTFL